jgi:spermidine/putrescine transport system permease protein
MISAGTGAPPGERAGSLARRRAGRQLLPHRRAGRQLLPLRRAGRRLLPHRNPWRHPWFLEGFTWLYVIWSLVPVAIAVLFSFNNGRSQSAWQGFSWRWYFADPVNSVLHDPDLHAAVVQTLRLAAYTTAIAVPLGVAFALGINRWRGRTASAFNFVMILSFVIPELIFAVALFFVFTELFTFIRLGTLAETLGLVTWNVSWPAIVVQARLVTIGRQYEEAAADLGANQWQVIRRVLVPLLSPAIFASAVLVFSTVIDDFVIVDLLFTNAGNTPMSVYIYSQQHGGNGGPALNALGTIMLVMSLVIVAAGYLGYRWMTRGERRSRAAALATLAGGE